MDVVEQIKQKAKQNNRTVVLPEGTEERTVKAAEIISQAGIAKVVLLGAEDEVKQVAAKVQADLSKVKIVEPQKSEMFKDFVAEFIEIKKKKVFRTKKQLRACNPLYSGR